jgi:hypothetical protein
MQEKHTFEYAVIRVVPRVEREEFMNIGIVLFAKPKRFLQMRYFIDKEKLQAFSGKIDVEEIIEYVKAFERICNAAAGSGPIGKLDVASRFRWLTATRSTVVQTSKVHPGMCSHAEQSLEKLFEQLVL